MRLAHIALLAAVSTAAGACSRQVAVTTPSTSSASVTLKITNNASQSVTVIVQSAGTDYTVGTVAANSTAMLSVAQVPSGSTVRLRATLADGSRTYTRDGVVMTSSTEWQVP